MQFVRAGQFDISALGRHAKGYVVYADGAPVAVVRVHEKTWRDDGPRVSVYGPDGDGWRISGTPLAEAVQEAWSSRQNGATP